MEVKFSEAPKITRSMRTAIGDLKLDRLIVVVLGDRKFVVRHAVDVRGAGEELRCLMLREKPDVIVFGHTHRPCIESMGKVLLFNPGYGGKQRFSLPRSVGILRCDGSGISAAHLAL